MMQYIACRYATSTTGALRRIQAYLYIHRNLSGDPTLDRHNAEVNARVAQVHELLRVRDELVEDFFDHIRTFWCVMWVESWRCDCLVAWFYCKKSKNNKIGLLGGRASMTSSISEVSWNSIMYMAIAWCDLQILALIFTFLSLNLFFFLHILCSSVTFFVVHHCFM